MCDGGMQFSNTTILRLHSVGPVGPMQCTYSLMILNIVVVLSVHGDATGETNCPVVKGALFHLDKKEGRRRRKREAPNST